VAFAFGHRRPQTDWRSLDDESMHLMPQIFARSLASVDLPTQGEAFRTYRGDRPFAGISNHCDHDSDHLRMTPSTEAATLSIDLVRGGSDPAEVRIYHLAIMDDASCCLHAGLADEHSRPCDEVNPIPPWASAERAFFEGAGALQQFPNLVLAEFDGHRELGPGHTTEMESPCCGSKVGTGRLRSRFGFGEPRSGSLDIGEQGLIHLAHLTCVAREWHRTRGLR
jgi:hypothetical protein